MDLKSLMNTSENDDRPRDTHKQPPVYSHQQHPPPSNQTPTTPAQNTPSYGFRESPYSHALHSSPGKNPTPQEYSGHGPSGTASYPPQTPYQGPSPYPGGSSHQGQYGDRRSPGASAPGPSPYRPTPSSSSAGAGYPFPATAPPANSTHGSEASTSPVQRHPHPPANPYSSRDNYAHAPGPPHVATTTHSHPAGSYIPQHQQQQQQQQQQHSGRSVPQTPPISTPGGGHSYIQQRSQSAHSSPTPTSAQSQTQFSQQSVPHVSPVPANKPAPPGEHNRHTSQPPTPLGPPSSAGPHQRQHSSVPPRNFTQPPSPYQQQTTANTSQFSQAHATPPAPAPPALPRTSSSYDQRPREPHQRSQSTSERDRSVSVSPKTRVPSLPSSVGGQPVASAASAVANPEPRPTQPSSAAMPGKSERESAAHTPAKRKLADRDLSPGELEKTNTRPPPPGQVNGGNKSSSHDQGPPGQPQARSPAAQPTRRKPVRYSTPPPWARKWDSRSNQRLNKGNFELQKRGPPILNGKPDKAVARPERIKQEQASRRNSPEVARPGQPPAAESQSRNAAEDLLGPWEPSITGLKPMEEMSRAIADFLFVNVVGSPDAGEIMSRGIQFEIEAKLGTIIDKDTNSRVMKFVATECILHDTGRLAFRSSMTEAQHKVMNSWLNDKVVSTNPQNPDPKARGRVQIHYKHRREVDRFFEIPSNLQGRLPGCVRSHLNPKHSVKVRVTYDQKTGQPLQKIVKARVADLHLHMPNAPLDCRISVNLETAWDGPIEELEQIAGGHGVKFPDRNKDRLSYTQSHYQVDLTQVTQAVPGPGNTQRVEKEHELEIELAPGITIDQGRRAMSGQPHRYQELVEGFLDNVRVLARATPNADS